MNDQDLKSLWQSTQVKMDQHGQIAKENQLAIRQLQISHFLHTMKPLKIFTLLMGILWVGIGGKVVLNIFIHAFDQANLFFLFSALIQIALTAIAIAVYIYQLILIYRIDISEPVLATQKKVARLRSSTLWVTKILFLQLPVWTTFYWNESMFDTSNLFLWCIQGMITTIFTVAAVWLFINIRFVNRDKFWFRWIFNGNEWDPILRAMELLHQINQYEESTEA